MEEQPQAKRRRAHSRTPSPPPRRRYAWLLFHLLSLLCMVTREAPSIKLWIVVWYPRFQFADPAAVVRKNVKRQQGRKVKSSTKNFDEIPLSECVSVEALDHASPIAEIVPPEPDLAEGDLSSSPQEVDREF